MGRTIVAFAGRARSGKSLCSNILKEHRNATVLTIASYLKKLCLNLIHLDDRYSDMTLEEMNKMKDKKVILNLITNHLWSELISMETGIDIDLIEEKIINYPIIKDIRELLQVIGTDIIRVYYPDWHIDCLINELHTLPEDAVVTIDDVRFPNELEKIEKEGGEVFFVVRPETFYESSNHPSETSLSWKMMKDGDHVIINDMGITINNIKNDILWYFDHLIVNKDYVSDRDTKIFASDSGFPFTFAKENLYKRRNAILPELINVLNRDETKTKTKENGGRLTLVYKDEAEKKAVWLFMETMLGLPYSFSYRNIKDKEEVTDPFIIEEMKKII